MTTKQRAALRAMCNTMEPVLHIGKDGITDNLVKQCWDALEARELIKVTVQRNAPFESTREACSVSASTPSRCRPSATASASTARRGRIRRYGLRTCKRVTRARRSAMMRGGARFHMAIPAGRCAYAHLRQGG